MELRGSLIPLIVVLGVLVKNLHLCYNITLRSRSSARSERRPVKPEVAGSSPVGSATYFLKNQNIRLRIRVSKRLISKEVAKGK